MSAPETDGALRVLKLLARRLEEHLDGGELALETLAEALEAEEFTIEDLQGAVLGLRGLARLEPPAEWFAGRPGRQAQRVMSAEERESLTTETWGYLLDLRTRGTLDPEQFERVVEVLTSFGERPVEVERAREVAARVALEVRFFERMGLSAAGAISVGMIDSVSLFVVQILCIIVITISGLASLHLFSSAGGGAPCVSSVSTGSARRCSRWPARRRRGAHPPTIP